MSSVADNVAVEKAITVVEEKAEEKKAPTATGEEELDEACDVNVRSEFKSCIDETLSTVCRVASMKRKVQTESK